MNTANSKIRILIVDQKRLRREGLKCLLTNESDFEVMGANEEPNTIEDFNLLVKKTKPDVLLVLGRCYLEALETSSHEQLHNVVVITTPRNVLMGQMINSDVMGIVLETSGRKELLSAIRSAARGVKYLDPDVFEDWEELNKIRSLSKRELEIFHLIAQGAENLEIAGNMNITESTVKNYTSHILKKLALDNRTQAAVFAWRNGMATISPKDLQARLKVRKLPKARKLSV